MSPAPNTPETAHLRAVSLVPAARQWLKTTRTAQVLHVFEQACNLVSAQGEVLSLVTQDLDDGPFTARALSPAGFSFTDWATISTAVRVSGHRLQLGSLSIDTADARLWNPVPDWPTLSENPARWQKLVPVLEDAILCHAPPGSLSLFLDPVTADTPLPTLQKSVWAVARPLMADLLAAVERDDRDNCQEAAAQLAGLGGGLTPASDDFLLGLLYGLWATRPECVDSIGAAVVEGAVPRTTRLSGAWLQAGLRGEAGSLWHALVDTLIASNEQGLVSVVGRLSRIGHTSGTDALAGFAASVRICLYLSA